MTKQSEDSAAVTDEVTAVTEIAQPLALDEMPLSATYLSGMGKPNIHLDQLSYNDGIAILAVLVTDQYDGQVADFDLDDADLQAATDTTRVDVGSMFIYALVKYLQDHPDAIEEDLTSMDQLRPYWSSIASVQAFEIYQLVSHYWLQCIVSTVQASLSDDLSDQELTADDRLWIVSRLNTALMSKYRALSEEVLDICVERAAICAFFAIYIEDMMSLFSVKIRSMQDLSARAHIWCVLMNVVEFVR